MLDFHPNEDGNFPPLNKVWSTKEYNEVIDILTNIIKEYNEVIDILTNIIKEYNEVIDILTNVWTPFRYGSSFCYEFNESKLVGFKTHD